MDDRRGLKRSLPWLLLLLLIILVWWLWRPVAGEGGIGQADATGDDPDDVLVDFGDSTSDARIAAIGRDLGVSFVLLSSEAKDDRLYRAHVDPARRDALLAALSRLPEVEIAEPDAEVSLTPDEPVASVPPVMKAAKFPNDPEYRYQWHLDQIHMPAAWTLADGEGVTVAVIDTGVAYEKHGRFHQVADLAQTGLAPGYNFVADNAHANDDHGHGTHVAGTIAQSTNNGVGVAGIARRARIMPLKVLSAQGSGSVGAIADAIDFAADHGAQVINMSLGGPMRSRILEKACARARARGVVIVAAAGNDGRGRLGYPAAYDGVISVAAVQLDETTTFYSNWGKGLDIAAPGGNTRVNQNKDGMPDGVVQNTIATGDPAREGYYPYMGTSMASPHVAGVAALLVGAGIKDPARVEEILKASARRPKGWSKERYGAGILDAAAAVRRATAGRGLWQLGLAVAAGLALVAGRKKGLGASFWGGLVAGSSGLFFVPLLGRPGAAVADLPGVGLLCHGFPSWDLALFGPAGQGNPLFMSALVPLALIFLFLGARFRPVAAGFAAGVAGHLLFALAVPVAGIRFVPDLVEPLWLLGSAALALSVARLATLERA